MVIGENEMKNGRKSDIIFADFEVGGRKEDSSFYVYADKGLRDLISSVEGVMSCFSPIYDNEYLVITDPRYDVDWVKEEIKAAILCRGEE